MERRRAKLSLICVSVILILSVALTFVGVFSANSAKQGTSSNFIDANTNIGGSVVADVNKDTYLGGIDEDIDDYIARKNYEYDPNWLSISNNAELKAFLQGGTANGKNYSGKHGYLIGNISDFNWDSESAEAAYLAPRVVFSRQFDGCGYEIHYTGTSTTKVTDSFNSSDGWTGWKADTVEAAPDTITAGVMINENTTGFITISQYKSAAFGGFVSQLAGGALTNFKFVIESSHRFKHNMGTLPETVMTVGGGLVGYQTGGKIDNVVVELAANQQIGATHAEKGCGNNNDNTSINGLVVGAISGGSITNAVAILGSGSEVTSFSSSYAPDKKASVSYAGGIVGYVKRCDKIANVSLYGNGGVVKAFTGHAQNKGGQEYTAHEFGGGIAGRVESGINIAGARVTGDMNCVASSNTTKGGITKKKNIGVAEGSQPSPMLYIDANGGTDGSAISDEVDKNRGYSNNKDKIIMSNLPASAALYFDKGTSDGRIRLFIPDNNIVWTLFGERKVSELITGADFDKLVFEVPQPSQIAANSDGDRITGLEIGTSGNGEVGIYMRDPNGVDEDAAFDDKGDLTAGTNWTEMSDQARAARAGVDVANAPVLYYDGTTYVVKIKISINDKYGNPQPRLFSGSGLNVKNVGDLKNSQNSFNGRPVKLYCDNEIAYVDEYRKIIVMTNNLKDGDMSKTLTIQKRYLWVNVNTDYERGTTTIFEGATISFGKVNDDPNTGLVKKIDVDTGAVLVQDYILWQDTRFNEGDTIKLDVAGHQMLRPSTNNYIIKHRVYYGESGYYDEDLGSYFSAIIAPHNIKVSDSIYINGAAVNGEYNVKNARTDKAEYNDTKRKIVVTARLNDSHFNAKRVVFKDKNGNEVTTYLNAIGGTPQPIVWKKADGTVLNGNDWSSVDGLVSAELYINDSTIKSIEFVDWQEHLYTVSVNNGKTITTKDNYKYGARVYLNAEPVNKDGYAFVGWQREKDNSFISYLPNYSLKVTEDFNVTAIYDENTASKTWTHEYYGRYGRLQRKAVAADERPIEGYELPVTMGWKFDGWDATIDRDANKVVFNAKFVKRSDNPNITYPIEPTVNVVWVNPSSPSFVTEFGAPIKLEANKTYLINGAEVVVGEEDMTIYAITDMTVEEIDPNNDLIEKQEVAMNYNSFVWNNKEGKDNKNIYYINITFVYGDENAYYGEVDRPTIVMDRFDENDFSEYNRIGNIYQLIMIITEEELECRFGNDSEIATFLTVKNSPDDIDGYTYENIMIFRRHSSDTTTQ